MENLSRNGAGDNVDEDDEDDRNENGAVKPRKAAKVGSKATSARLGLTNTIEKNPKNLNAVKVDGENVTDPMFQKMSKAFDEGGAKGMLMNNLKVTPHSCSLIFSENEDTVDDTSASDTSSGDGLSVSSLSDLINRLNITPVSLGTSQICPVLDDYRNIVGLDCPTSNSCLASMVSVPVVSDLPAPTSSSSHEMDGSLDSYAGDCVGCDDGDDHEDAFASEMGVDINCEDIPLSDENNGKWSQLFGDNATPVALSAGGVVYDNVASNGGSAAEKLQWDTLGVSNANDYSFFNMDSLLASGSNKWAGSRHWKFAANKRKEGGGGVAASKAAKAPKDRILIDFADEKLPAMSFFAPPAVPKRVAKGSSGTPNTMYTEAIINKQQLDSVSYLLPEDSKIQLHDLCRLFLRPNMIAPPPNMLSMFQPKSDDTSSSNKFLTVTVGSTSNDMIWGVLSKPTDSLAIDDDDCGPSHEDGNYMTEGGDIMYYNNAIEDDGGDDDYGEGHDNDDALISDLTSSLASGLKINSNSLVQAKRTVGKINVG